jgi:hypothetical protein
MDDAGFDALTRALTASGSRRGGRLATTCLTPICTRRWQAWPRLVCGRLPGRNRRAGTMAPPRELIMSPSSA